MSIELQMMMLSVSRGIYAREFQAQEVAFFHPGFVHDKGRYHSLNGSGGSLGNYTRTCGSRRLAHINESGVLVKVDEATLHKGSLCNCQRGPVPAEKASGYPAHLPIHVRKAEKAT
jgi:hypothetical protein